MILVLLLTKKFLVNNKGGAAHKNQKIKIKNLNTIVSNM
jgi:hypothetical protein